MHVDEAIKKLELLLSGLRAMDRSHMAVSRFQVSCGFLNDEEWDLYGRERRMPTTIDARPEPQPTVISLDFRVVRGLKKGCQ